MNTFKTGDLVKINFTEKHRKAYPFTAKLFDGQTGIVSEIVTPPDRIGKLVSIWIDALKCQTLIATDCVQSLSIRGTGFSIGRKRADRPEPR